MTMMQLQYIKKTALLLLVGSVLFLGTGCSITDGIKNKASSAKEKVSSATSIMGDGPHVVIVPGYGAPVEGNPSYQEYIRRVSEYVVQDENKVDVVVFTGSYSTLSDLSEAEAMNRYFNRVTQLDTIREKGIRIYKEECAIVSWQNIAYTKDLLSENNINPSHVTVFGDVQREEKLLGFATVQFNADISIPDSVGDIVDSAGAVTVVDFIGFTFGSSSEDITKRNAKFAAEIAGAYDAEIGNEILATRIGEWSDEFDYDVASNLVKKGCIQFSGF